MEKRTEINLVRIGAVAAIVMALSTFIFFALFNVLSTADPRTATAQFLGDAAEKQGLATAVAWLNAWLGFLTVPIYLGLYYGLRRSSESLMLLALIFGLGWGMVLIVAAPTMFALLAQVAPAWATTSDSAARTELLNTGTTLGWIVNSTIGGTVFFLRTISLMAVGRVMLLMGGRLWAGLGWLAILFGIEHIVAGILRLLVPGSGAAAGSTLLGAISGVLLFVWLIGAGVGLWRLRQDVETSPRARTQGLAQATPVTAEHAG